MGVTRKLMTLLTLALIGLSTSVFACNRAAFRIESQDCSVCPVMIELPPSNLAKELSAQPKSPAQSRHPQRTVRSHRSIAVGKFEVTNREFQAFVLETGYQGHLPTDGTHQVTEPLEPATNLSWDDAQAYVSWLSTKAEQPYRLLTEAEWEFAASHPAPGNLAHLQNDKLNGENLFGAEDGYSGIAPVGKFKANAFGLHDMQGNVSEWVADCGYAFIAQTDSSDSPLQKYCDKRVIRGGSWMMSEAQAQYSSRSIDDQSARRDYYGLRVARSL